MWWIVYYIAKNLLYALQTLVDELQFFNATMMLIIENITQLDSMSVYEWSEQVCQNIYD